MHTLTLKISPSSLRYQTKKTSFEPIPIDDFRKALLDKLLESVQAAPPKTLVSFADRGVPGAGLDRPEECGWTFMINRDDTQEGQDIIKAIKRLAIHRQMDGIDSPLTFNNLPEDSWDGWLDDYSTTIKGQDGIPPQYILIIGSTKDIPLEFQSKLSAEYFVGRLEGSIAEIKSYVDKIVDIEKLDQSPTSNHVTFFATDHQTDSSGCYDPTYLWRHDVESELINDVRGLKNKYRLADDFEIDDDCVGVIKNGKGATKANLENSIKEKKPCLVYAAGWGMFAPGQDMAIQKKFTGALICHNDSTNVFDSVFTADDVSHNSAFLEGGVFFSHSSFSYGAPYKNRLVDCIVGSNKWSFSEQIATNDFISSLPKKLVFHPNGPLAFVGHFDDILTMVYKNGESFDETRRKIALNPISRALQNLLLRRPVGYALTWLSKRHSSLGNTLGDLALEIHKLERNDLTEQSHQELTNRLIDTYLKKYQSENYMIFGDPAAHI